jgi:hypothetical protein
MYLRVLLTVNADWQVELEAFRFRGLTAHDVDVLDVIMAVPENAPGLSSSRPSAERALFMTSAGTRSHWSKWLVIVDDFPQTSVVRFRAKKDEFVLLHHFLFAVHAPLSMSSWFDGMTWI